MHYAHAYTDLLRLVQVRPIHRMERARWDDLIRCHHYLGLRSLVGESIRYVAVYHDEWLALIGWSAAALKCKPRDQWIGWPKLLQFRRLPLIANNTRFLILPHHPIPNLASRILALNLKRLSADWETVYHHPIWLVETFVDPRYFEGTCYRAQGWIPVGYSRGFAKSSRTYWQHNDPKKVFIKPLQPREKLSAPSLGISLHQEIKPMNISEKEALSLQQHFLNIPEPRNPRGVRHHKISLLVIALCAILSNAQSFVAIAEWAKRCSQNMLKRLRCRFNPETKRYEPPSEPTLRRFLQAVDAEAVDQQLSAWLCTLSNPEDQPTNNCHCRRRENPQRRTAEPRPSHPASLCFPPSARDGTRTAGGRFSYQRNPSDSTLVSPIRPAPLCRNGRCPPYSKRNRTVPR